MCYDISVTLKRQLKKAKRDKDPDAIAEIEKEIERRGETDFHHVSGFQHPELLIYTNESPEIPVFSQWGLIPHWTKNEEDAKKYWNNTLNARGESLFDKPSFREAAVNQRCLVYINGFFEHHHFGKQTYPFHIKRKDGEMLCLGGLFSEWKQENGEVKNTFSIVTTPGNSVMKTIHNNPKLSGPRMPLILSDSQQSDWLTTTIDPFKEEAHVKSFIHPTSFEEMEYFSVGPIRGNNATGNTENAVKEFTYPELWTLEF